MDLRERILYHQIHPAKLVTDIGTAIGATPLFWRHHPGEALALGFLPSIAVTAVLLRWGDLEPYRASRFGQFVKRYMTRRVEMARLAGLIPLWGGAWFRLPLIIMAGAAWIVGCWLWGLRPSESVRGGAS